MRRPYSFFKYEISGRDRFTVIAHRGASAYYPENTIESFAGAIKMGAEMVELDVQLSRDGKVVVFHDEKINRCTNGRGKLAAYDLAELKKFDAGSWFSPKFKGANIPTLDEVLDLCCGKIAVNIEIKTEAVTEEIAGGIEEKCLALVEKHGMRRHVVFSSFDPRALAHLKEIDQRVSVAVLYDKKIYRDKLPSEIVGLLKADAFNCAQKELSKKRQADLRAHGISVNVYTVDLKSDMRKLLEAGVDGIFTNKPDVLKKVADEFRGKAKQTGKPRG
ncbi:MAG TPA: glycerophosphodiester phosphodiesterase family protein [Smithellaceae bacterium]|nr:glycerophosphodiester phosphodiesterase family protein [Smithellaceae bacterium]HRS89062.1 glycerophosphodiester phosphodiesterase family protein [Smithellaceae bacterium]HRV25066.1 glycerophosphodiester phosphodiesterase family protein [Smithellaceae bacterium]